MFSIVVAVRDGAASIAQCLDSVVAQTMRAWELVVMDAASTDSTPAILAGYDSSISYWESEPDRGITHAWNKALTHARGQWVLFLGADDRLAADAVLAEAARRLPTDPDGPRIAYARVNLIDSKGIPETTAGRPWGEARQHFFRYNTLPHQAVFHHRSLFDRNGLFDESFRICADYELLLREIRVNPPLFMPDLIVADVATTGMSYRPDSAYRATREFRRAQYMHGVVSAPEWRSFRIYRSAAFEGLRRVFGHGVARSAANAYRRVVGRFTEPPD
jgi:glycosyltransferase involved in cell wall biosynthesis